uniref:hAT-like transposase RNase-H fold domain-containing protein n=1 Tax=Aegilops tauschii subsp. strangulata TaxID=200361 RepID=A0A453NXP1_AEGTS
MLIKYHKHELLLEGQHLHVRCCAHILNILVQDGMKIIHEAIDKIRQLLKFIDSSPSRLQDFMQLQVGWVCLQRKVSLLIHHPDGTQDGKCL